MDNFITEFCIKITHKLVLIKIITIIIVTITAVVSMIMKVDSVKNIFFHNLCNITPKLVLTQQNENITQ